MYTVTKRWDLKYDGALFGYNEFGVWVCFPHLMLRCVCWGWGTASVCLGITYVCFVPWWLHIISAFSASGDDWGDHPGDLSVSLIKSPCIHIYLMQCLRTVAGAIILATFQWLYRYCIRIYCIQCFRIITLIVDLCAYLFFSLSL